MRSAAWRFSLCVSRSIRSEPWSVVRELGGRHTHTQSWPSGSGVHALTRYVQLLSHLNASSSFLERNTGTIHTRKWVITHKQKLRLSEWMYCTHVHTRRQTHKARTNQNKHTKSHAKGEGISCLFRLGKSPVFFPAMRQTIRCKWNLHEV